MICTMALCHPKDYSPAMTNSISNMPVIKTTQRIMPTDLGISNAGALLRSGGLVAFPTETVYGLGADATNGKSVAGIYAAKGRPSFNPLIIHVNSLEQALSLAEFNLDALKLAEAFWPGPLTIVAPKKAGSKISDLALAGLNSIAIRVPSEPVALAVIAAAERPIAAPSANRSGRVSPTTPEHVLDDLNGLIDAVIIGETAKVGLESTIIACLDLVTTMLRPGGLSRERIEKVLGHSLSEQMEFQEAVSLPVAPGMLSSHYAPRASLRIEARDAAPGEAVLLFGRNEISGLDQALISTNLSENSDLVEAAANLFKALRMLDASGAASIAVAPVPNWGLGEAINDRLRRAAAPRF